MKKLLALALAVVVLLCCLVGCSEGDKYNRERFYGVVRFSEESNQLVVYIPSVGDVAIPESEGCCSCFDGHEENDDKNYQLKVGDLVSINFRYEKSWDDNSVQIMESYPGKFDRKAHLIEALKENISFAKIDGGYVLSFPSTAEIESAKIGDKYALTERLICGECKTPYRRCTWTIKGQKKIVWRCINRLDFGKKYCHESPTVEESILHEAIMRAIMETAQQNIDVLKTLKMHIGMGLRGEETEDISLSLQIRMAEIDAEFNAMLNAISSDEIDKFDEQRASELLNEKNSIQSQLAEISESRQKRESTESRLDEIYTILDGLKNHPMEYDDQIVRQIIECVIVESKEQIRVIFAGGLEVTQSLV